MSTLLAADVGNTNIVLGAYDGAQLVATWRTATRQDQTEDELAVMVDALLERQDLSLEDIDALVLGSVVPPLTASFTRLAERYLDRPALVIGPGTKTGVRLRVDNPSEVGADRIANTLHHALISQSSRRPSSVRSSSIRSMPFASGAIVAARPPVATTRGDAGWSSASRRARRPSTRPT